MRHHWQGAVTATLELHGRAWWFRGLGSVVSLCRCFSFVWLEVNVRILEVYWGEFDFVDGALRLRLLRHVNFLDVGVAWLVGLPLEGGRDA